jgi:hypothetical protein
MPELWEGARRLPYFFTWQSWILCPQCVLQRVIDNVPPVPHFHVSRSVMCARCSIVIGPINDEEMVSFE